MTDVATILALEAIKAAGYASFLADGVAGKSRIVHDLGIQGDDLHDLLDFITQNYGADFSDIHLGKYSLPEGHLLTG
ncbi:hypothetical protein ABTK11_20450, partial [Acinetobacter baumannii]